MKKVFKKSIAFVIAALMIFSTLPLTPPISVEAATAYITTGEYNHTSSVAYSNNISGYTGSNFVLRAKAWDTGLGVQDNTLKYIDDTFNCVTYLSQGNSNVSYNGGSQSVTTAFSGLYVQDGLVYIQNLSDYINNIGFRISWTQQYYSKSSASGAGVFSIGTSYNGDVIKWTTTNNDNKLYVNGSSVLSVTPQSSTVYDITLTMGTDKKINILVKNHSTNAEVINYTTSGTYIPTSLKYLVIGSCDQSSNSLGTLALKNLKIEKAYDTTNPLAEYSESVSYVKANIDSFNGYTGNASAPADNSFSKSTLLVDNSLGINDKMSNVLYSAGTTNEPRSNSTVDIVAAMTKNWIGSKTHYYVKTGMQYGNMAFLYDGQNECANVIMSYNSTTASEGGMQLLVPTTAGFSIKSNWHGPNTVNNKTYTGKDYVFGNATGETKYVRTQKDTPTYFYNTLCYTGTPSQTVTTINDIEYKCTIHSEGTNGASYDGNTGNITFGTTNTYNGPVKIYIVNYQPIKSKISTIKSIYNKVKDAGDNAYCAESLGAYYKAVEKVLRLDPNDYSYSTDLSGAVTNVGADIDSVVNNYLTTATTEPVKHSTVKTKKNVVASTCTASGSYDEVVTCILCTAELSNIAKTTEPLGHDLSVEVTPQNNATCTQTGTTAVMGCSRCDYTEGGATIPALGHSFTNYTVTQAATCSAIGKQVASCDRNCGATDEKTIPINPNAHNWGKWTSISDTQHQRKCTNDNSHIETDAHTFENGVCKVCTKQQTFTIKFKNQDGSVISSKVYNYGNPVTIPDLPPTKYTYNNETHTVTTYSWNFTPNPLAQGNATYQVNATNSEPVACSFVCTESDIMDGKIKKDEFTCSVCGGVMYKVVADKTALNHAIEQLEALVNDDGANYKYEANALANAKNVVATAKDFVQKADRYAEQTAVNGQAKEVNETITTLTTTGLAQYTVTFNLVNADTGDTIENASSKMKYGDIAEKTYTFNKDEEGFPEYVVCKWTKKVLNDKGEEVESVINSTSNDISDLVKENATYTCYVLKFKASTEGATETTTRVRYLDKSGKTLKIAYAKVGSNYQIDPSVSIPNIPYYKFDKWECRFGTPENVGTREIVYQATYKFNDTVSNRCQIVGLKGVLVNGVESYSAIYDEKIVLTGADKFAYANAEGSIIAPINENYIFAPHLNGKKTIYITKVETPITEAKSIITGVFTTDNDPTYNYLVINAQYYLPEGAKAVEAGAVIGKQNDANVLKVGSALKVVSDTQGENHEYSLQMSYSKNKSGTLYARSYLIYVDSKGDTHTVYSDIAECVLK